MKKSLSIVLVLLFSITCVFNFLNLQTVSADPARTKEIQQRLADYGYYSGEINGWFDDATVVAIKQFQANNGLNVTGAVDSV